MKGRILIGGTNSGAGKTTITIALLEMLKESGMQLSAFKCGPDYIDPMFHREVLGVESGNIDSFFYTPEMCRQIFCENAKEFSVIEGVMGYYDGGSGATSEVAKILDTPTILVVNAKGAFQSVLATIHGFLTWRENNIAGVILNNTTQSVFSQLQGDIEGMGIAALGYVPKLPQQLLLESRHLGLVTAAEIDNLSEKVQKLAEILKGSLDIQRIMEIGFATRDINVQPLAIEKREKVRIAVAKDEAFCFCYRENISLLEKMGGEICYFSPLKDKKLPDCDGLYLVGGYPELYAESLQSNVSMRENIKSAVENSLPTIAECGGFMYLTEKIDGKDMCGVISGECEKQQRLVRFGYIQMHNRKANGMFLGGFKGHEFHYYDSTNNGEAFLCKKQNGLTWQGGHQTETMYAGFAHLALASDQESAKQFYDRCLKYKKEQGENNVNTK